MKQCSFLIFFVLFASLVFFVLPAASQPVEGFNSYIELLPGGRPLQLSNEEIITKAQAEIIRIEAVKRERKIKFIRPIDIVRLNSTYSMISFEVSHTSKYSSRFSKNPAVFSLLFDGNGPTGLKRYAENYIKWFGPSDIEQYNKSSAPKFCEIFTRSGVKDCVFEAVQVAEKKKDPAPQTISADMIQSGIVKAEYIDKSVVTENELQKALEENNSRMMKDRAAVDNQTKSIKTLRDKIKQLEGTITRQSQHAQKLEETITQQHLQTQQLEETITQQHLQIQQFDETLTQQQLQAQKLETTVNALAALLKGVSRSKNELLLSGINLHIVNGTGRTHGDVNGTGNLIVGYNEKKPGENLQMESHEIIAPHKSDPLEKETATEEKTATTVNLLEEIDSKPSGLCFIDTARF